MTNPELVKLGLKHHQAGRLLEAESIYRQALAADPNYSDALHLLGVIFYQAKKYDTAIELVRRAIALKPQADIYYSNYGVFLEACGRHQEAVAAYRRALQINPNYADVMNNLGNLLRTHGDLDESIVMCRGALKLKPEYPEALNNLANSLHEKGEADEAIALYRRAIEVRPNYAQPYSNLGNALKEKGRIDEAIAMCRRALELDPAYPDAMSNLGACLFDKGMLPQAAEFCQRAVQLRPDYPEALNNLGTALRELSRMEEAVAAYQKCIALRPGMAPVYSNLGTVLKDLGSMPEAIAAYDQALKLDPKNSAIAANRILAMHYLPEINPTSLFEEHLKWDEHYGAPVRATIAPHDNDRSPDRPLRIGYVSADLRRHSVAFFLLGPLHHHDRGQFHVTLYSTTARADEVTAQMRQAAENWVELTPYSDDAAAEKIRSDKIDILIDLGGFTANNRMPLFARKPAPVMVEYLGYPNTSGLQVMDWRLTDEKADPAGAEALHTEKLMRLPETAWCFYPISGEPPLAADDRRGVVFGSFNDFAKLNTPLLHQWARILNRVSGSRLLIKNRSTGQPSVQRKLRRELEGFGVSWDRVELVLPQFQHEEHLRTYNAIDIALDTFPYHGTTTTCEAMWMGVPVVSRAGQSHVSRVGVSLLKSVGLDDLVGRDEEEYADLAVRLAEDRQRLRELRRTLRQRMKESALMDGA
ncbi:MAG TPA: tetratricopeptide repeat protein, partial [Tepidisphaeraceae bacterium]|nr:tetratricopeptide repeat protein [Tepidisphaeraceae bacterium]